MKARTLMKRLFLGLLFAVSAPFMWAEDMPRQNQSSPPKTLFGDAKELRRGWYGAPVVKVIQIGSGVGTLIGGRGAIIFNRMVSVGGAGYGLVAHSNLTVAGNDSGISMGYGGPGVGVKLFADEVAHIDMFNLFGFGRLSFKDKSKSGAIFIIEPEVNAEFNLLPFLQLGLGVHYRFTFSGTKLAVKSTDLFGFGGQIYVQFSKL